MINKLKVKRIHPDAVLPKRAKEGDVAYDLVAIDDGKIICENEESLYIEYRTGLTIEPPKGYHTEVIARSSITNYDLILKNNIALFDNNYRGEFLFRFFITRDIIRADGSISRKFCKLYKKGDRIAQLLIRKTIILPVVEVEELSETNRGEGKFGSTGT